MGTIFAGLGSLLMVSGLLTGQRVLIIGDSHAAGEIGSDLMRSIKNAYRFAIIGSRPVQYISGNPGVESRDIVSNIDVDTNGVLIHNLMKKIHPTFVVVILGTNIRYQEYLKETRILTLCDAIKEYGSDFAWVGVPKTQSNRVRASSLNKGIELALLKGGYIEKFISLGETFDRVNPGSDGIHYSGSDAAIVADYIRKQLNERFGIA